MFSKEKCGILYRIYSITGIALGKGAEMWWEIRDYIIPPKERAVVFVSHPDDDVLFFHSFIKKYKPYVVCLTTGELPKRIFPFYRVMKHFGVKYRFYCMKAKDIGKEELIRKRISRVLKRGQFSVCATHNETGEYGHIMHQCVHRCVRQIWKKELFVPVDKEEISKYPLSLDILEEKTAVLKQFYSGEYPTLCTFDIWITHEHLVLLKNME